MITDRYVTALQWAAQLHQGQVRKGTEIPYLAHALAVSGLVLKSVPPNGLGANLRRASWPESRARDPVFRVIGVSNQRLRPE